jgi:hypothetical protein
MAARGIDQHQIALGIGFPIGEIEGLKHGALWVDGAGVAGMELEHGLVSVLPPLYAR